MDDETRSVLNQADGLLGLIVHRNQRDDVWMADAQDCIRRIRALLKAAPAVSPKACPTCGVSRPIDPGATERHGPPPNPCPDPFHSGGVS